MIKIKSNKQLFDRWKKFDQGLAGIVQNDMSVSEEQIAEWAGRYQDHIKKMHSEYTQKIADLSSLVQDTILHIQKCRSNNG